MPINTIKLRFNVTLGGFSKIQGREIDYNTLVDIYSAWEQISSLYSNLKNQLTVKSTNSDGYEFTTQFTPLTGTVFTVAVKFGITVGASLSSNLINSFYQTHIYDTENIKDNVNMNKIELNFSIYFSIFIIFF